MGTALIIFLIFFEKPDAEINIGLYYAKFPPQDLNLDRIYDTDGISANIPYMSAGVIFGNLKINSYGSLFKFKVLSNINREELLYVWIKSLGTEVSLCIWTHMLTFEISICYEWNEFEKEGGFNIYRKVTSLLFYKYGLAYYLTKNFGLEFKMRKYPLKGNYSTSSPHTFEESEWFWNFESFQIYVGARINFFLKEIDFY
uniref:Uncharacterized protein n=1 Tax=candidate division WOR-3 bacterium TaxID=2052148 RepID=A0A7C4Y9I0_UNCW3